MDLLSLLSLILIWKYNKYNPPRIFSIDRRRKYQIDHDDQTILRFKCLQVST